MSRKAIFSLFVFGTLIALSLPAGRGWANDTPTPAPEFAGISDWLNSDPLTMASQRGKVVVLHFWTNGCSNCVHNYVHYRAWQEKYKNEKNFLLIGVHTPEFEGEKDVHRIRERMAKNGLTFAVAVDNEMKTWDAWKNGFWPCIYLVDKSGNVRRRWDGELDTLAYSGVTRTIDELLAEPEPTGRGKER